MHLLTMHLFVSRHKTYPSDCISYLKVTTITVRFCHSIKYKDDSTAKKGIFIGPLQFPQDSSSSVPPPPHRSLVGFEAESREAASVSGKQGRLAALCERGHGRKYPSRCLPTGPQGPIGLL